MSSSSEPVGAGAPSSAPAIEKHGDEVKFVSKELADGPVNGAVGMTRCVGIQTQRGEGKNRGK
jgi:hypothetical protein